MNYLILLLFVSGTASIYFVNSNKEVPPLVADLVSQAVQNIKDAIHASGKGKGIESLDTLHFEYQNVDLCGPIMCISANFTGGTLRGLGGFEALKSEFVTEGPRVTLNIDVNFPFLGLESEHYEMKGNIMGAVPLSGRGKLYFETKNLRLWTKVTLKITEDGTAIEEFDNPGFSIQNIYSHTEFDGNIDPIFNTMVEELLVIYLNRFNKAIAAYYSHVIKELLNPIL